MKAGWTLPYGYGTRLDGSRVLLEVEDNGVGIPDSIIDKVFEPFFTTKESQKGIGLGVVALPRVPE